MRRLISTILFCLTAGLAFAAPPTFHVVRIVDGDTIVVRDRASTATITVRLIGVDTPETVKPRTPVQPYGKEASLFTRNLLTGEDVWFELDPVDRDYYGRMLAYVYRAPDGLFVNRELVRQGYGRAYPKYWFSRKKDFLAVEAQAKAAKRGLWGAAP